MSENSAEDRIWTVPNAAELRAAARRARLPVAGAGAQGGRLGGRAPRARRLLRLAGRQDRSRLQPDEQARPDHRPGGRPALHPRHALRRWPCGRSSRGGWPWRSSLRDADAGGHRAASSCAASEVRPRHCRCTSSARPPLLNLCTPSPCCSSPRHDGWYADLARVVGWAFAIWGTGLYWWAGVLYVVQVRQLVTASQDAQRGDPVKAVVMAGGEGTRLRPMTANQPKPLLPVVNRPIMEHVLRLLQAARAHRDRGHRPVPRRADPQLLRRRRRARHEPALRHRGHAARHRRQRQERRRHAARRPVPGHLRRRADRHRPDRHGPLPPGERRAGDHRPQTRAQPAGVRHHHRRRAAAGCSASWRSPPGARSSPTPSTPASTSWSPRSSTRSPPASPSTGPPTSSPACWSAAPRCTATSPTATGRTSAPTRATSRPRPTRCPAGSAWTSTASRCRPGVWVAEGASVDPDAVLKGPLLHRRLRQGRGRAPSCASTPCSAATSSSREGAFLHRAVVHDNVYVGPGRQPARLRDRQEHRRDGRRPGSRRARSSATSASSRPRRTSPPASRSTRSRPSRPARSSTPA